MPQPVFRACGGRGLRGICSPLRPRPRISGHTPQPTSAYPERYMQYRALKWGILPDRRHALEQREIGYLLRNWRPKGRKEKMGLAPVFNAGTPHRSGSPYNQSFERTNFGCHVRCLRNGRASSAAALPCGAGLRPEALPLNSVLYGRFSGWNF